MGTCHPILTTAGAAILVLAASCAHPVRTDGPVTIGSTPGVNCVVTTSSDSYTMGFDLVRNSSSQPVDITGVSVAEPSDITVVESYLVPVPTGGGDLVGVGMPWPPSGPDLPPAWSDRMTAVGHNRLAPEPGRDGWNLVLHLATPTATRSAGYAHVVLEYTHGGQPYEAVDRARLEIREEC